MPVVIWKVVVLLAGECSKWWVVLILVHPLILEWVLWQRAGFLHEIVVVVVTACRCWFAQR